MIASLEHGGIGPVIAADFSTMRREMAERMGDHEIVDPAAGSACARRVEIALPLGPLREPDTRLLPIQLGRSEGPDRPKAVRPFHPVKQR